MKPDTTDLVARLEGLLARAKVRGPLSTGARKQTSDYGDDVLCVLDAHSLALACEVDPDFGDLIAEATTALPALLAAVREGEAEIERLKARLNTPEIHDFTKAVSLEAAHQRERWGAEHDAGKTNEDWFWLIGHLAGKALNSAKNGDDRKALHHTVSTAAALANWHAALNGDNHEMRPGILEPPTPTNTEESNGS